MMDKDAFEALRTYTTWYVRDEAWKMAGNFPYDAPLRLIERARKGDMPSFDWRGEWANAPCWASLLGLAAQDAHVSSEESDWLMECADRRIAGEYVGECVESTLWEDAREYADAKFAEYVRERMDNERRES